MITRNRDAATGVLSSLFRRGRPFLYDRGDTIIRAGDIPSGLYLITEGWVQVYCLCDDGETNIISSLSPPDIFPLEWAATNNLRDISFAALMPTTVLRISRETLVQAMERDQRIARAVSQKLGDYYSRLSNELEHLAYHSARERVAFRLLSLADRFGKESGREIAIKLRVPNEYIARSSNMTRETASREISRFQHKGVIEHHNGYIIIKDINALKQAVGKTYL